MSDYKWFKIGTKINLRLKFYLLPIINKIHLKEKDSYEWFIYNVRYIYARNKKDALYKYNKYHKFSIKQYINDNDINDDSGDLLGVLQFYPLVNESPNLYSIRSSFKSLFCTSLVIGEQLEVLDKDATLTPNELTTKCSIQDYLLYYKHELYKKGLCGMEKELTGDKK